MEVSSLHVRNWYLCHGLVWCSFAPLLWVAQQSTSATQTHSAAVTASGTRHWKQDVTHICLTAAFIQACAGICSTFSRKLKIKSKRCSLKLTWWCLGFLKVGCWVKIQPPVGKLLIFEVSLHGSFLLEFLLRLADDGWSRRYNKGWNKALNCFCGCTAFVCFGTGISDCQLNKLYLCSKDTCLEFVFFPSLHKDTNRPVSISALPRGVRWTLLTYIWQNPLATLCTSSDTRLLTCKCLVTHKICNCSCWS